MSFRKITLLDTSVGTRNLGDEIIVDAVRRHLDPLISDALMYRVATHDQLGPYARGIVAGSDLAVAAGTNLLTGRLWFRATWPIGLRDALAYDNVVLMGCGWYQYQRMMDPYTRFLWRKVLSKTALHATRDGYSRDKLKAIGIENVINTGCPTLWQLTPEHCAALPKTRANEVVTTVNSWFRRPAHDRRMLEMLRARYEKVHVWVQTDRDLDYALSLDPALAVLPPSLAGYDALLASDRSVDYVGNRLHGGIRALQHGRRAVILEVDNRAREMGRDFGLPTVAQEDYAQIEAMIDGPLEIMLTLPEAEIARFKAQFVHEPG